jgi:hypothetical protein
MAWYWRRRSRRSFSTESKAWTTPYLRRSFRLVPSPKTRSFPRLSTSDAGEGDWKTPHAQSISSEIKSAVKKVPYATLVISLENVLSSVRMMSTGITAIVTRAGATVRSMKNAVQEMRRKMRAGKIASTT